MSSARAKDQPPVRPGRARPKKGEPSLPNQKAIALPALHDLRAAYDGGASANSLAKQYGVSRTTITMRLLAAGGGIRSHREAYQIWMASLSDADRKALAETLAEAARRAPRPDRPKKVKPPRPIISPGPGEIDVGEAARLTGLAPVTLRHMCARIEGLARPGRWPQPNEVHTGRWSRWIVDAEMLLRLVRKPPPPDGARPAPDGEANDGTD
jgi:hypothetical protein